MSTSAKSTSNWVQIIAALIMAASAILVALIQIGNIEIGITEEVFAPTINDVNNAQGLECANGIGEDPNEITYWKEECVTRYCISEGYRTGEFRAFTCTNHLDDCNVELVCRKGGIIPLFWEPAEDSGSQER